METKPKNHPRIAFLGITLFLLCTLLVSVRPAQAGPGQQEGTTPTIATDREGTPSLLQTPFPTESVGKAQSRPGALFATVGLLLCGMVGMLVAGVGIAVVMVRLRTRRSR